MIYLLLVVVLLVGLALVWYLWRTGPKSRGRSVATGTLLVGLLAAIAAVLALAYRRQRKM